MFTTIKVIAAIAGMTVGITLLQEPSDLSVWIGVLIIAASLALLYGPIKNLINELSQ